MNHLLQITGAADRTAGAQTNFETLDASRCFALTPSKVGGVATVNPGPPAAGKHYLGELWTDVNCATWRCSVSGTPGTWQQIAPAVVDADPAGVPDGYVIERRVEFLKRYRWDDGGAAWAAV